MGKVYDADSLLAHVNNDKDTHKDKYKDKDKYKMLKRPITWYIFVKQGVKGYQIWNSQWPSESPDSQVSPESPDSQVSPDSPDSAESPDSPDLPDSAESQETPDSPNYVQLTRLKSSPKMR